MRSGSEEMEEDFEERLLSIWFKLELESEWQCIKSKS